MPDDLRSPIKHHLVLHRIDPEQGIRRFYSLMIERDLFGTVCLEHRTKKRIHDAPPLSTGQRWEPSGSDKSSDALATALPIVPSAAWACARPSHRKPASWGSPGYTPRLPVMRSADRLAM